MSPCFTRTLSKVPETRAGISTVEVGSILPVISTLSVTSREIGWHTSTCGSTADEVVGALLGAAHETAAADSIAAKTMAIIPTDPIIKADLFQVPDDEPRGFQQLMITPPVMYVIISQKLLLYS